MIILGIYIGIAISLTVSFVILEGKKQWLPAIMLGLLWPFIILWGLIFEK
jgi:hypothetical protein